MHQYIVGEYQVCQKHIAALRPCSLPQWTHYFLLLLVDWYKTLETYELFWKKLVPRNLYKTLHLKSEHSKKKGKISEVEAEVHL